MTRHKLVYYKILIIYQQHT